MARDPVARARSALYTTARALGDAQAVRKGRVGKRLQRRALGRLAGRTLGWIDRATG